MSAESPISEPTVDVIVVTWNNGELAIDCLEHLRQNAVAHRLIVVDNASEDGTVDVVRERFPDATVIALPENVGYGRAVNRGIQAGQGRFIAFVNNDANVAPDFLENVMRPFADPRIGMVGGLTVNPANGRIDAAGMQMDRGLGGYLYLTGRELSALDLADPTVMGPACAISMFRREMFEQTGAFDEEIFAYCEEVDLVLRCRSAGWKFAVAPDARAMHIGSATLGSRSIGQMRFAAWSRGYIAGRYRIGPLWLLTELAVGMVDAMRLRSPLPFSRRIAGWRRGRALPRRRHPDGVRYLSWPAAMRLRLKAM